MYESEIRKIFLDFSYLLNDVAEVKYPKGVKTVGFPHRSTYSCDNVVLWMLCHDTPYNATGKYGTTTGFAISSIREILRRQMDNPNLKFIGRGKDKDYKSREEIHESKKKSLRMGEKYIPGYIAIKVSLSDVDLTEVYDILNSAIKDLEDSYIVLHDIDVFVDCGGITNRSIVQKYLLNNNVDMQSIVNDKSKVGDDCISWMDNHRRNKVYNKYIQMLQSCDVRKAIGSIIADLVYNPDDKFTDKLLKYRDKGMSRVETTFYSNKLMSVEYYKSQMDDLLEFLDDCPVYHVSFEKQWQRLSKHIHSSFAVYIKNKKIFTYSHWWNSITGKIQGYSRHKVSEEEVEKLLANYSFNDHPMYFVKGDLQPDGSFKITKKRTYHRDDNSTAMTFVPGAYKGLYPSFAELKRRTLSFKDVGIVTYKNITIGWSKKKIDKRSKALAKISYTKGIPTEEELENPPTTKKEDKNPKNILKEINISTEGRFQSAYTVAEEGDKIYTIIGYGRRIYYGEMVTHLLALDGKRIRCTKKLQEIVETKITERIYFQIRLICGVEVNKYRDVKCEIVEET